MRTIMSIITIGAAGSLLGAPFSRAQETVAGGGAVSQAQQELARAEDEAQKAQADAKAEFAKAQQQMERAERDMAQAGMNRGGGGFGGYNKMPGPGFPDRFPYVLLGGPDHRAGRTLVIRSSESDLKEQAKLEEDLAVMSHILDKAVSERAGGHGGLAYSGTAMGIDVLYTPAARALRSLYLEGYGALFLLNVGSPLLPPPQAEDQQEKTETTTDWEDAKQELFGQSGGGTTIAAPSEPYDKERVNRLKEGLLESLKNATNIRDLKPDDSITVCVFGAASSDQPKPRVYVKRGTGSGEARYGAAAAGWAGSPMRQTIMTVRVKKSDADAFAKGAMTLEAFRERAHIVSYAGSPETGSSFGGGSSGGMMGGFGGGGGVGGGGFGGGGGGGVIHKP